MRSFQNFCKSHVLFQDLCRINNQLLIALGVGHPKIDQICTLLARYGIHPKMTGAGGGGSVFAFLKPGTTKFICSCLDLICKEWIPHEFNIQISHLVSIKTKTYTVNFLYYIISERNRIIGQLF